jgi:hypothetical protein
VLSFERINEVMYICRDNSVNFGRGYPSMEVAEDKFAPEVIWGCTVEDLRVECKRLRKPSSGLNKAAMISNIVGKEVPKPVSTRAEANLEKKLKALEKELEDWHAPTHNVEPTIATFDYGSVGPTPAAKEVIFFLCCCFGGLMFSSLYAYTRD